MSKQNKEQEAELNDETGEQSGQQDKKSKSSRKKYIGLGILIVVLLIGAYVGYGELRFYQSHVETDDAQTEGYISPVLPRVSGYVDQVLVNDNERVKKGQLLVTIDSAEYALKTDMAKAALENARAALQVAKANVASAEVAIQKADIDYRRTKDLYKDKAATQSKLDDVIAERKSAHAGLTVARRRLSEVQSQIKTKQDQLKYARLRLSYTHIVAPSSGLISKKDVEVGQLIQPGQPLMAVTDDRQVWVVANFKETELSDIHVGQKVNVHIDAYPDKTFKGKVQSVAGATGAKYSLLPPENATGNFVKVVQRVPVKIEFTGDPDPDYPIRLGLNVTATIDIRQHLNQSAVAKSDPIKSTTPDGR